MSCGSNQSRAAGFIGWAESTGRRPATSTRITTPCPVCKPVARPGRRRPPTITTQVPCRRSPTIGTAMSGARIICRPPSSSTCSSTSRSGCISNSAQCIFTRVFRVRATADSGSPRRHRNCRLGDRPRKWNSKGGLSYQVADGLLVYADASQGFRDGGVNVGLPSGCTAKGIPLQFTPDTLTNYELGSKATLFDKHLIWDTGVLLHAVEEPADIAVRPGFLPLEQFQYQRRRCANLRHGNADQVSSKSASHDGVLGELQRLAHHVDRRHRPPGGRGRRAAAIRSVFQLERQCAITRRRSRVRCTDTPNTMSHTRATCGTICRPMARNGLPRVLQPGYSVMNLRFGFNQIAEHWTSELFFFSFFFFLHHESVEQECGDLHQRGQLRPAPDGERTAGLRGALVVSVRGQRRRRVGIESTT